MSKTPSENRCQQTTSSGRRCRSPRSAAHPSLCSYHAREESQKNNNPLALAVDLLGTIHDFRTATSVNHVLGKLLVLLATDRVPPRNAAVIAYICQLLLQSLSDVKHELYLGKQEPDMKKALRQVLHAPSIGTEASKFADQVFKLTLNALEHTEGQVSTDNSPVPPALIPHPRDEGSGGEAPILARTDAPPPLEPMFAPSGPRLAAVRRKRWPAIKLGGPARTDPAR